jgi:hypothetical protein
MVMTEWMKCVKEALKTVPKNTPNRLKVAMGKAKLTYKKTGSTSSSKSVMKKTFKRRNSRKGRKGKGSRRSKRQRGGAMTKLNPAEFDGKNVGTGTSGVKVQFDAVDAST